jgi:hypothetical protein
MNQDFSEIDVELSSDPSLLPPSLAAVAGLAAWVGPSLTGAVAGVATDGFRIREAWDTPLYWAAALPLLAIVLASCGYFGTAARWRLALWALVGHIVGMVWIHPEGTSLMLLPLTAAFFALFLFPLLWVAALAGGGLARVTSSE